MLKVQQIVFFSHLAASLTPPLLAGFSPESSADVVG